MMRTLFDDAAESMTSWWDDTTWLPFVEAENGNITGPGHQDKNVFAATVTVWDRQCGSTDATWAAVDVGHLWVTTNDGWETWRVAPRDTENAVPVTCIWGKR